MARDRGGTLLWWSSKKPGDCALVRAGDTLIDLAVHYAVNLCVRGEHVDMFLIDDGLSSDGLDVESLCVVSHMLEVVASRWCCKDAVPAVVIAQLVEQHNYGG